MNINSTFSYSLLRALSQLGARDVVVSPGSRSQALALAAAECEKEGYMRLHVRTDEREAAFYALGLAKESGIPAPIITTSGSAVGNLLPAVMEGWHSRTPMLVLSADRPARLRGAGANQTTFQPHIFGRFAPRICDIALDRESGAHSLNRETGAAATEEWDKKELATQTPTTQKTTWLHALHSVLRICGDFPPFPVHVNIQFDMPLSGQHPSYSCEEIAHLIGEKGDFSPHHNAFAEHMNTSGHMNTPGHKGITGYSADSEQTDASECFPSVHLPAHSLVIAGFGADAAFVQEARTHGATVIADITSRCSQAATIAHYRTYIKEMNNGIRPFPPAVAVTGTPNLSREIPAFLSLYAQSNMPLYSYIPTGMQTQEIQETFARPHPRTQFFHAYTWENSNRPSVFPTHATATDGDEVDGNAANIAHTNHSCAPNAAHEQTPGENTEGENTTISDDPRVQLLTKIWALSEKEGNTAHYLAASSLVRIADEHIHFSPVPVYSHRGLAGIDGTISVARGVQCSRENSCSTHKSTLKEKCYNKKNDTSEVITDGTHSPSLMRLICGDLTFLYGSNALQCPAEEQREHIQIIVIDDNGGHIFSTLEVAEASPELYHRVVKTPPQVDIFSLARSFGWQVKKYENPSDLVAHLAHQESGIFVLHIDE